MLNKFPRHGKIISLILITGILSYLFWDHIKVPDWSKGGLKPGSPEYNFFHHNKVDTIPADSIKLWEAKAKREGRFEP